jgi:hypothetical protein
LDDCTKQLQRILSDLADRRKIDSLIAEIDAVSTMLGTGEDRMRDPVLGRHVTRRWRPVP